MGTPDFNECVKQYRELERTHNQLLNIADLFPVRTSLKDLLSALLKNFRNSVQAEAGTIFLIEKPSTEAPIEECNMVFHIAQNDRIQLPELKQVCISIDKLSISGYISITRETLNIPDVYEVDETKPYRFNRALDERLNYRSTSILATPMTNKTGDVIGVLMLINCMKKGKVVPFPEDLVRLVKFQSGYAGMVIENAQIYQELEKERKSLEEKVRERTKELEDACFALKQRDVKIRFDLENARLMQTDIMPKEETLHSLKENYSLRISSHYSPCEELGGDLWDVVEIDEKCAGIILLDFAGHGVTAALNTFQMKSLFHEMHKDIVPPSLLMSHLNEHLRKSFAKHATGVYLVYDRESSDVTLSRAGHPYPLLYRAKTGDIVELQAEGACLGLFPDVDYEECTVTLETGDKLFLFTDGLYEVINATDNRIGFEKMRDSITRHAPLDIGQIYENVVSDLLDISGHPSFNDDVILLVIEKANE